MENKYITVAYKLYVMQDGQKTLVEEATVEHPFQFISGLGTTLERFETEITALKKGDKFEFVIPTAEAYGEYMPEGVRTVSKDMFTIDGVFDEERIFPGAVIPLQDNEGHHFYATVSEVTNDTVTVDLNHPHAGKDLTFEGEVVESRTATNEEIQEMVKMMSGEGCGCGCVWERDFWMYFMSWMRIFSVFRRASCRKGRLIWSFRGIISIGAMRRRRDIREQRCFRRRSRLA